MKELYYDCFSGISGDMNLGAMIDLGIDKEVLINQLNKLNLKGWDIKVEKDQRHGITGTKVTVIQTKHEHIHRHLSDIELIINQSDLDEATKSLSLDIFRKVAEAEAKVHGTTIDHVHFHEVGAIDSIIDIVGAAICYNILNVNTVHVSRVELGGGFVKCAHGTLPVPAPATAEIMKNIPARKDGVNFEATTPTGAAIVSVLGNTFGDNHAINIQATGYGIGQKENPEKPNILRVYLGETVGEPSGHDATLLQCNIDDMNPEIYSYLSEKLFNAGAADVYLTGTIMKKNRPGNVLNIITENDKIDALKNIIFTESTTTGIRVFPFKKETLTREFKTMKTEFGDVSIKYSYYNDKLVSAKPEYEDCKKIASEQKMPLKEVYNKITSLITKNIC